MSEPAFRHVDTNGVTLRVAIKGEGPLVLFVHGFPESWYSWRHQLEAVSAAGFTAAAVDVRGYGGSDKPHPVEAYDMQSLTGDMAGVAEALQPSAPAVIVGHDWGAPIAWNTALLHPDRFRAVAGLSVPYIPQGEVVFIDAVRKFFTEQGLFFYQVYFQDEGVAEAEAERDPREWVARMMYSISGDVPPGDYFDKPLGATFLEGLPDPAPVGWLTEDDLDFYEAEFKSSGFRGPLNRYRNWHRDNAFLRANSDQIIRQPSLFIGGTRDLVLKMYPGDMVAAMKPNLPGLRGAHLLEGCGHWTQQERADEVNRLLLDWLATL